MTGPVNTAGPYAARDHTAEAGGQAGDQNGNAMTRDFASAPFPASRSGPNGEPDALQHRTPVRGTAQDPYRLGQERHMRLAATSEPAVTHLPGRDPVHARDARRRARVLLAAWGLDEHASVGELVVSELVSNAVCHGEMPIWVALSADGSGLRVEVHDGGAVRPVRQHPGNRDECGRGLEVLDGLIELHGGERGVISDRDGPGKTVYVVLSLAATPVGAR
jgi:anti-sigma regulatory factor (Ser/Thr protein kinase)